MTNPQAVKAQALVIAEAIRALGSVPSGHLYARLMSHFSFEEYEQLIGILKSAKLVKEEESHLLVWIGAEKLSKRGR